MTTAQATSLKNTLEVMMNKISLRDYLHVNQVITACSMAPRKRPDISDICPLLYELKLCMQCSAIRRNFYHLRLGIMLI